MHRAATTGRGAVSRPVASVASRGVGRGGKPSVAVVKEDAPMEDAVYRSPNTCPPMKMNVHDLSFSSEELLLQEAAFPNLRSGDLVHLFLPGSTVKYTLRIKWLSEVTDRSTGRIQVCRHTSRHSYRPHASTC
jgi:hypothetical protein